MKVLSVSTNWFKTFSVVIFLCLMILLLELYWKIERLEKQSLALLCHYGSCPVGCDVCCQLPYNVRTGEMMVHHLHTERGLWNEEERFVSLPLTKNSMVVYVGANTEGRDGKTIMDMFGCTIHIYEPVPQFSTALRKLWDGYSRELGYNATVHSYGLGNSDRTVFLSPEEIDGQSTFGMAGTGDTQAHKIPLLIREAASVLAGLPDIALLHVNCEGCEWEMLENIIKTGQHKLVRTIQFGSHYFTQVANITARYCWIREQLGLTHRMVFGQAWGWERWERRLGVEG